MGLGINKQFHPSFLEQKIRSLNTFFRGMDDWMSQSLGRAKPNEVKPVLKNRTKGKRDINT